MIVKAKAIDFLSTVNDCRYEAVITDPPFGIGKNYIDGKELCSSPNEYGAWILPHIREMMRVLKPGGFLAVWQTQLYMRHFWDWFGEDIHIYISAKNFVQLRKTPINYAYDPVVMMYKPGAPALRPEKPKRNVDFFVANTAVMVRDTTRIERNHPYPRPIDQVLEIVQNFTIENALVCDPFVGSGTVPTACRLTGRRYEVCDIEQSYIDLSVSRVLSVPV